MLKKIVMLGLLSFAFNAHGMWILQSIGLAYTPAQRNFELAKAICRADMNAVNTHIANGARMDAKVNVYQAACEVDNDSMRQCARGELMLSSISAVLEANQLCEHFRSNEIMTPYQMMIRLGMIQAPQPPSYEQAAGRRS